MSITWNTTFNYRIDHIDHLEIVAAQLNAIVNEHFSKYKEKRAVIGKILRQLCEWKGVRIVEAEVSPDHVHMMAEIPPKISVPCFMGYLKGKSSTMLYEQFGELKYKYRNREFWCKGYYIDTVGKNETRIAEYIANQLKEDMMGEQLTMGGDSPFTGGR